MQVTYYQGLEGIEGFIWAYNMILVGPSGDAGVIWAYNVILAGS